MTFCQIIVKKITDKYRIKVGDLIKLVPHLGSKTNYVIHYRYLQLYLSLGLKLIKIHKLLKFKQFDWMKKYIDFNTKKRTNAAYTPADQLILLIISLIKIMLLFMKLNKFYYVINQFMSGLLFLS